MMDWLYYYCSIEGSEVCGIPYPAPVPSPQYAAATLSWSDDYWKSVTGKDIYHLRKFMTPFLSFTHHHSAIKTADLPPHPRRA